MLAEIVAGWSCWVRRAFCGPSITIELWFDYTCRLYYIFRSDLIVLLLI